MCAELYEQIKAYVPWDEEEKRVRALMLDFLQREKNALSRENALAHFTVSAWIVNHDRRKVLMAYHNIYRSWAWIGGHADGEEDLFAVLCREVAEESGLERVKPLGGGICGINLLAVEPHLRRGEYVNAHLHFDVEYFLEADERQPVRVKADENSAVGWLPVDALAEYVSEEKMKPIYAKLNEKLKAMEG